MGSVLCRVSLGLVINVLLVTGVSARSAAIEQLNSGLAEQDDWLTAAGLRGEKWQAYLQTELLREELSNGPEANKRAVARVLGRYQSGVPGLSHPRFQRTRLRLETWANELGVPLALRWAGRADGAALTRNVINPAHVSRARQALRDAAAHLNGRLATAEETNERAWRSFLRWNDLQSQLQLDAPDWTELGKLRDIYYSGHRGLELPEFVDLREALRQYHYVGILSENPDNSRKILSAQLKLLSASLVKHNDQPSTRMAAEVATLASFLADLDMLPGISSELRRYHNQPNILVQVSENFVARRFADTVQETRPVNEMILKTHVRGQADTTGTVTADVVPSSDGARIDIVMHGTIITRSRGRQKPVTIRSQSNTSIAARKGLLVQPRQITSLPANADGQTYTHIFNIVPDNRLGRRLVEKIAWQRAAQQKPVSDRIASQRAARRIEAQFDRRTEELLGQARQSLREKAMAPLERRGLIPDSMATQSSDTHILVTATQAKESQLAAASAPAPFSSVGQAIAARVHESAVNNTAQQAIAGLTLTDERIAELMEELTGSVPEELQPTEDSTPWSISFDLQQPFTVEFSEQTVRLAIRGRRFTSGERVLDANVMEISATYLMATSPAGIVLTRQGEIEVAFPATGETERLSTTQIFFRTLMRTKFSALFKPLIEGEGIALPGRWKSTGKLRLKEVSSADGWLSLGWN